MRSLLLLSILLAATACSQSLTPGVSGTGGTQTGTAGAGGSSPGTGGLGGSNTSQLCDTLIAEYRSALTAAETCQVGASGQCQQIVAGSVSGCACPSYVTDSTALSMIVDAWRASGCVVPGPACNLSCPAALTGSCVATDGGSAGFCSYVPGAGGTSGSDGTGGRGAGGSQDGGTLGVPGAVIYPSTANAGAYMLELSNAPLDCQSTNPSFACSPAGVTYWVQIQMPPEDLTPGVYPLSGLIYPYFSETGPNIDMPSSCWGGGGDFSEGTLEIVSVSSTDLVFRLHGTLTLDFNVNGATFTANLCAGVTAAVPPVDSAAP